MANFDLAYKKTSVNEGGWANVIGDRGGPTYCGIAYNFWPNWAGWDLLKKYYPLQHNQVVNDPQIKELVKQFYKNKFWDAIKGDIIKDQALAERIYDMAVTAGIRPAISQLQAALGIAKTGILNSETIEAINNPSKYLS